jgi:hypothetical protein
MHSFLADAFGPDYRRAFHSGLALNNLKKAAAPLCVSDRMAKFVGDGASEPAALGEPVTRFFGW